MERFLGEMRTKEVDENNTEEAVVSALETSPRKKKWSGWQDPRKRD